MNDRTLTRRQRASSLMIRDRSAVGAAAPSTVVTAALGLLVAFVVLAFLVHGVADGAFGDSLDAHLVSHPGAPAWRIASIVSNVGAGPVVGVVAGLIGIALAARHRLVDGAVVVVATAAAGLSEVALKAAIGRNRPTTAVLSGESGQGFPSGHVCGLTALVVAAAVVVALAHPQVRERVAAVLIGALLIVVMAWSRVVVGAHYLTDTVGGLLLGAATALVTVAVASRFEAAR